MLAIRLLIVRKRNEENVIAIWSNKAEKKAKPIKLKDKIILINGDQAIWCPFEKIYSIRRKESSELNDETGGAEQDGSNTNSKIDSLRKEK